MSARFACRSSGETEVVPILDLGRTPLANALLTEADLATPEPTWPLELVLAPGSALVQITETVPPEILFRDYRYFSSFSDTMLAHARGLAERLRVARRLDGRSLVVEVASNDGYLLRNYLDAGVPVLGIEPATNIARVAALRGIPTRNDFFGASLAEDLRRSCAADVIHAHNVLAHVADLNGVVRGFRTLVKDEGLVVIEAPYVKDMIDRCEFDTIYHEHLCYFSLTALDRLLRRHDLIIEEVARVPIHGGSLQVHAAPAVRGRTPSEAVRALLDEEARWGVDRPEFYADFARRVEALRSSLRALVGELKAAGRRIAAYGAAAKGATLLNTCGLGAESIDFVVDRSPHKQGRYMPGARVPIVVPERLVEAMPDVALLLSWNFADEILAQQAEYRRRGGRFIIPVPEPRLTGAPPQDGGAEGP